MVALAALGFAALAACGSTKAQTFTPQGGGSTAVPSASGSGPGSLAMPPFGSNAHIDMTNWMPADPGQAQAVLTDKDYQLAYLYAEYTGGKDQRWTSYASTTMQPELTSALAAPGVTTESFIGTIRFSHMTAIPDPNVRSEIDVSACFDNAQSSNTNLRTGKVIPDNTPLDQHYFRYTDVLGKSIDGQWQEVSEFPHIYYPRAKECKP